MMTDEKPTFRDHAEEIAWHLKHRHGGPTKLCDGCNNQTMGYTCEVCEQEYQEARRYGRMPLPDTLCSDCAKPCISCKMPVCESHSRHSGECVACSGPTDREMQQQADGGSYYSSERMAALQREIL